jgi:hypothetical protein
MRFTIITMIVFLFLPLMSYAQEKQLPVDKVDQMQKLEGLTGKLDQLKAMAESMTKEKYYKCVKAFGDTQFCKCLADNHPVGLSFEEYITIVTANREELDYKNRSDEGKQMIDLTYKTREMCVNIKQSKNTKKK